jgi:hypothetical protein
MYAIAELSNLPETKEQIRSFVEAAINEVLSGDRNPLELDLRLKALEELVKNIRKDDKVKAAILNELNKYAERLVVYRGVHFQKKSLSKYDYTSDSRWCELDAEIKALSEKKKEREEFLRTLREPMADMETGEIIQPIYCKSEETYSVTFK